MYNSQLIKCELYRQGRRQDLGGGPRIFFSDLGICMSRSMLPREFFFKTMQFGAYYFDQILYLFFFQKLPFFI